MGEEWKARGPSTLHGVLDSKFPNLFLSGPFQAAASINYSFALDNLAKHAAYIVTEAIRRAEGKPVVVRPTEGAAEEWAMRIMMGGASMSLLLGCTPGYINAEGGIDKIAPENQLLAARWGVWGSGIEGFVEMLEGWRAEGGMRGIEVRT